MDELVWSKPRTYHLTHPTSNYSTKSTGPKSYKHQKPYDFNFVHYQKDKNSISNTNKTKQLQLRKIPNNTTSTSYTTKTIRLQFRTLPKGYDFNIEHQQKLNNYNFVNYQTIKLQLHTLPNPYDFYFLKLYVTIRIRHQPRTPPKTCFFNFVHHQIYKTTIPYTTKTIPLQCLTLTKLYNFNFVHCKNHMTSTWYINKTIRLQLPTLPKG